MMKKEFEIWNDVSIGYWNSKEFIQDRLEQQYDWLANLWIWKSKNMITEARYTESCQGAIEVRDRLQERLRKLLLEPFKEQWKKEIGIPFTEMMKENIITINTNVAQSGERQTDILKGNGS